MNDQTLAPKTVEILLAVYRPDWTYLEKLLDSLNRQTYPHCRLTVADDSDDQAETFTRLQKTLQARITSMPYTLAFNAENIGSSKTFGMLTAQAGGDLLAYCDQDDIWEDQKIQRLVVKFDDPQVLLAYTNLSVIDGRDQLLAPTLHAMFRRIRHLYGKGLAKSLLGQNCVTGCAMMIRREIALKAQPFPQSFVHDHWLAVYAAAFGALGYEAEPMVRYRLHGANQVGFSSLKDICDRESYVRVRLERERAMLEDAQRIPDDDLRGFIRGEIRRRSARIRYLSGHPVAGMPGFIWASWRSVKRMGFEGLLGILPQGMQRRLIRFIQNT